MTYRRLIIATVALGLVAASGAEAGQRRSGGTAGGGTAAPRTAPSSGAAASRARPLPGGGFRPYYYPSYGPWFRVGIYGWYPYGYYPYPYWDYAYGGYPVPPGYVNAAPGAAYGGVRIEGAPKEAEVYVDGYYAGIVDDFDGTLQHLNLPTGPHHIEVHIADRPPQAVDVRVEPGQTLTYHAQAQ